MPNDVTSIDRPILMGIQCDAEYREQLIPDYKRNPLIETLPDIMEAQEIIDAFAQYPQFDEVQRTWPDNIRMHAIYQLNTLIQPLPFHLDIFNRFSVMIRDGYKSRNPRDINYKVQFNKGFKEIFSSEGKGLEEGCKLKSSASGFAIIGPSGIGKSTSIEKTLLLYPQVIKHRHIEGFGYLKQVVWLKLDCPTDGSLKSLCIDFFQSLDKILGTDYAKTIVTYKSTVDTLMPDMAHIASLHGLGVLVIDEIQNLSLAKSGGEKKALNFFTRLVNIIGLPVVMVGTFEALYLFENKFAQARRACGMGDMVLDRIISKKEWDLIISSIWDYQWLKKFTPVNDALKDKLYEESQGIIDIVIKLFMHTQWKAIASKEDEISEQLITKAAEENLKLIRPYIHAIKTGNREKMKKYKDLKAEWLSLNDYILSSDEQVQLFGEVAREHKIANDKKTIEKIYYELIQTGLDMGLEPNQNIELAKEISRNNDIEDSQKKRVHLIKVAKLLETGQKGNKSRDLQSKHSTKKKVNVNELNKKSDLVSAYCKGLEKNIAGVDSLKERGFIASFCEFV
ncbi:ATP-binding protein [Mesobacillus selenatarsenatis]|uniref:Transposon Tn7 transposition protein tnsC n=1 Tax=Mesobacillus selenatarsenatis (strain DSM 18680 / JCM 14380 / FERM P-15431 / SF-1) TaxID=1321606 RepID=A0A0A8WX85_MESS1|nr:ATP-binding protein [Mesobacillus selenatarsenatis]GAM12275.1 transposon Tn7 transposition protein tnsC [Mesobacillus selenatarsenatis SF-1]